MLINIITENAVSKLLEMVERSQQNNTLVGALRIQFSQLHIKPLDSVLLTLLRPHLADRYAALYFLPDDDVVITWHGAQKAVLENIQTKLLENFSTEEIEKVFEYFDIQAHGEDLRAVLKDKQKSAAKPATSSSSVEKVSIDTPRANPALALSEKDIVQFRQLAVSRKSRLRPEILIVEDQAFSRKVLSAALGDVYKLYEAVDAETALQLYLQQAPDIVFLDIELPGMDGHQLAQLLHKLDTQSYVVMVTGNSQIEDVQRAKDNAAKGFIVKPYNKQKIFDAIQKYITNRK